MISNRLLMNSDKTEDLLIRTRQQLSKVNIDNVKVGSADIAPSPEVKTLGVWFDLNLSMSVHITRICSAAFYHLYNIRKIRKYLTTEGMHRNSCTRFYIL